MAAEGMTINYECKAVLTKKDTGVKSVFASKNDLFEEGKTEAERRFSMIFAEEIQAAEKGGKVEILCRPFCNE